MNERTILHLDVDAFFASVEQQIDPALSGRAVIVGGFANESGVVASCSYEARASGVHSGMALSTAARHCPEAVFVKGDFANYKRVRDQIKAILLAFSPSVEFTSIDDAYIDLTGLDAHNGPPLETAARMRKSIFERTGLSVSIGLGNSKVIARIASGCAKPAGILRVLSGYERPFLREIRVDRLPGVGPLRGRILDDLNVRTIGQLARLKTSIVETLFGRKGRQISHLANAIDPREVAARVVPHSISRETTFPQTATKRRTVESMLHYLTERALCDLRGGDLLASGVEVKIVNAQFERAVRRRTFKDGGSDQLRTIYGEALQSLRSLLPRRVAIRLVGVALLSPRRRSSRVQQGLPFGSRRHALSDDALSDGIDRIRKKFGFGALTAGRSIELIGKVRRGDRGFILRTPSLNR